MAILLSGEWTSLLGNCGGLAIRLGKGYINLNEEGVLALRVGFDLTPF